MNQRDTVLVTGGSGFVAGWCIVELLNRGYRVRTTVRKQNSESRVREAIAAHVDGVDRLSMAIADLTQDAGWDDAVAGCRYVLHVASPLGGDTSRDANALLAPAKDGTLRVLAAARRAGVKRVVMTSAAAAARPRLDSSQISNETIWADPEDPQFDAYRVSKILAEKAAWADVQTSDRPEMLTTILPGAVFGPVLSPDNLGSVRIIHRLLDGRPAAIPRLGFSVVDVRDLAALHVRAMTEPAAAGERFLATGEFLWMIEIADVLRSRLGPSAVKVPTRRLPDWLFRLAALAAADLRSLSPLLGVRYEASNEKARRVLRFTPRPAAETIADTARRLAR